MTQHPAHTDTGDDVLMQLPSLDTAASYEDFGGLVGKGGLVDIGGGGDDGDN